MLPQPLRAVLVGVALSLAGGAVIPAQQPSGAVATTLRAEYLVDPLALDVHTPRLSWIIDAPDARGVSQTAYQIIVASSAATLAANRGDLWDTGKVATNQTNQIEYGGRPLQSRQRVHWKVRVWNQSGAPSAWSRPASWQMGLLDKSDWSAQWIGDATPSVTNVAATMLRKPFSSPSGPHAPSCTRRRSASTSFASTVSASATMCSRRSSRTIHTDAVSGVRRHAAPSPRRKRRRALLGDGWYAGGIGLAQALIRKPRNIYGDHPRFLAQLEVTPASGAPLRIVTDASWRVTRDGPIRSSDILNGEVYNARKELRGWDARDSTTVRGRLAMSRRMSPRNSSRSRTNRCV